MSATSATAQYPLPGITATGRSFTLSDAAWKVFIPSTYYQRPGQVADVIVHFHGDPQTYLEQRPVGQSERDHRHGQLQRPLERIHDAVLQYRPSDGLPIGSRSDAHQSAARIRHPRQSQWDKIAVSSFSAGYGAVREILKSSTYRNEINSLLTADSLYATTAADGTPDDSQMVDYKTFANLAKNGSKTFLFSHSQVPRTPTRARQKPATS